MSADACAATRWQARRCRSPTHAPARNARTRTARFGGRVPRGHRCGARALLCARRDHAFSEHCLPATRAAQRHAHPDHRPMGVLHRSDGPNSLVLERYGGDALMGAQQRTLMSPAYIPVYKLGNVAVFCGHADTAPRAVANAPLRPHAHERTGSNSFLPPRLWASVHVVAQLHTSNRHTGASARPRASLHVTCARVCAPPPLPRSFSRARVSTTCARVHASATMCAWVRTRAHTRACAAACVCAPWVGWAASLACARHWAPVCAAATWARTPARPRVPCRSACVCSVSPTRTHTCVLGGCAHVRLLCSAASARVCLDAHTHARTRHRARMRVERAHEDARAQGQTSCAIPTT